MNDAAFKQQMKEIRRMISYLFMLDKTDRTCGLMKWGRNDDEYHFDWFEVKRYIPCPDKDSKGDTMYGHIDNPVMNLTTNTVHYVIQHGYDINRNLYPTIRLQDHPKLVDAIQKQLMGFVIAKAKEQAILKIQKEEIDKVLTGKYERLEHWK